MTANVNTSGSQTATLDTEHTLATITTAGTFCLAVDLANMVGGSSPDITRVKLYGKARSSDTERLIKTWSFWGVQSEVLWISPAFMSPHHMKWTLEQTDGTGRAYPWAVYAA